MSFSNLSILQNRNVNDLSKYVIGATINKQEEPSGIIPGTLMMGGISGSMWAYQNRKDLKGGFKKLAQDAKTQKDIVNSAKNKWAGANEITSKTKLQNIAEKAGKIDKKTKLPKNAALQTEVQKALKLGKNYADSLKTIEQKQAVEALKNYNAKVATQVANGSKLRAIKNATGITKISKATKELAVKSGKFRSLLKGVKGNAGFAAISFGLGVLTDVVPAFTELGAEKGFKQLGKTALKTGFEVAGWAAGAAVGAKAGAVIGSFCGPIGTVVGGAIGLIGGFVGSFIASKIGDKVVGPSEVEIAEQKAAKSIAKQANSSPENLQELALASYEQLVDRTANGQLTEDDMAAKKALEGILGCKINLEEEVKAKQAMEQQEATSQQPQSQVQPQETLTQSQVAQHTAEPIEESEENKDKDKEKQKSSNPVTTTPQYYIPNYMQMYNPMNLYNSFNPYMTMNTNPFANDMYFQKTFQYTNPANIGKIS